MASDDEFRQLVCCPSIIEGVGFKLQPLSLGRCTVTQIGGPGALLDGQAELLTSTVETGLEEIPRVDEQPAPMADGEPVVRARHVTEIEINTDSVAHLAGVVGVIRFPNR